VKNTLQKPTANTTKPSRSLHPSKMMGDQDQVFLTTWLNQLGFSNYAPLLVEHGCRIPTDLLLIDEHDFDQLGIPLCVRRTMQHNLPPAESQHSSPDGCIALDVWLESLQFGTYAYFFELQGYRTVADLRLATKSDFQRMGVPMFHRAHIIRIMGDSSNTSSAKQFRVESAANQHPGEQCFNLHACVRMSVYECHD
jgi:hypothetical protein